MEMNTYLGVFSIQTQSIRKPERGLVSTCCKVDVHPLTSVASFRSGTGLKRLWKSYVSIYSKTLETVLFLCLQELFW